MSAAFVQRFDGPADDLIMPIEHTLADTNIGEVFGTTALTHLRDFTVAGPLAASPACPKRRAAARSLPAAPTAALEESACAADIVRKLASQAYRGARARRTTSTDLMSFYERGRKAGDFESGIRHRACRRSSPARASCSASSRRRRR